MTFDRSSVPSESRKTTPAAVPRQQILPGCHGEIQRRHEPQRPATDAAAQDSTMTIEQPDLLSQSSRGAGLVKPPGNGGSWRQIWPWTLHRATIQNRFPLFAIGVMLGITPCISTASGIGPFRFRRAFQFVCCGPAQAGYMLDARHERRPASPLVTATRGLRPPASPT